MGQSSTHPRDTPCEGQSLMAPKPEDILDFPSAKTAIHVHVPRSPLELKPKRRSRVWVRENDGAEASGNRRLRTTDLQPAAF